MSTAVRSLGAAVLAISLAACTGAPASTDAWSSDAEKSVGAVVAGLGTAQVVLETVAENDLPHSYAVVTLTDAVETAEKESAAFRLLQPPDDLHAAGDRAVRELDAALELLVKVRVEYASPGLDEADGRRLLRQVRSEQDRLQDVLSAVQEAAR